MAKLEIDRGTTYTRSGTVRIDGVLVDLTNATVRFTVKSTQYSADLTDSDAVISKNITDGTALGEYQITIAPADTQELLPGKYFYSIKVDLASDGVTVYELDEGTIKLDGDPTNRLA